MSKITSGEIRLASRPNGIPTAANFTLARTELPPLQDQHVLVRNLFMSVDPYMRGRMNDRKSYVPPFELGKPLDGGAVGEVIESRAREFKPGDAVTSSYGWREYFIVRDWLDRQGEFEREAVGYWRAGKLKNKETVVDGIDQAVGAFIGLFHGQNVGKMVVKLI